MMIPALVGHTVITLDEIDSTNKYAIQLCAKSNPTDGTVIITEYQTAGQGQIGRKWYAQPSKNLLMSVILKPKSFLVKDQAFLSFSIALAIWQVLDDLGIQNLSIKWPNDIYIKNKKVAGILIQNALSGTKIDRAIVGIGLNVNQEVFPDDLPNPTSISQATGMIHDRGDVQERLLQSLSQYYWQLQMRKFTELKSKYESLLFGLRTQRQFEHQELSSFSASVLGVDDTGAIILDCQGEQHSFQHGELKWIISQI